MKCITTAQQKALGKPRNWVTRVKVFTCKGYYHIIIRNVCSAD